MPNETAILAYQLMGRDNRTWMWEEAPDFCSECGTRPGFGPIRPTYKPRSNRSDVSSTYDGYEVITEKFRQALDACGCAEDVVPLPASPGHHILQATRELEIDHDVLRFINPCSTCGNHQGVHGEVILTSSRREPLEPGLYRSDVMLADRHSKHYVFFLSPVTVDSLLEHGISDEHFVPMRYVEAEDRAERIRMKGQIVRIIPKPWWKFWDRSPDPTPDRYDDIRE